MICIRFFRTRRQAEIAKKILIDGGIHAEVSEDKFEGVPIQKYNIPARFRLNIHTSDLDRAATFLSEKLKQ